MIYRRRRQPNTSRTKLFSYNSQKDRRRTVETCLDILAAEEIPVLRGKRRPARGVSPGPVFKEHLPNQMFGPPIQRWYIYCYIRKEMSSLYFGPDVSCRFEARPQALPPCTLPLPLSCFTGSLSNSWVFCPKKGTTSSQTFTQIWNSIVTFSALENGGLRSPYYSELYFTYYKVLIEQLRKTKGEQINLFEYSVLGNNLHGVDTYSYIREVISFYQQRMSL